MIGSCFASKSRSCPYAFGDLCSFQSAKWQFLVSAALALIRFLDVASRFLRQHQFSGLWI